MAVQKTIQDYYERLYEEYPTLPKEDIRRACQFGWKSIYLHNSYGGDTLISRKGFWFYCGQLMNNSLNYFNYYKRKIRVKLRIMFKRKKIDWDGYYYFALSQTQYNDYLNQKNKKGRPKKKFKFSKIVLYKIYDECNIAESSKVALFRIPYSLDMGFTIFKEEMITDKAEFLFVREPLKFNDILLSNYDYQFISDELKRYNKKQDTHGW